MAARALSEDDVRRLTPLEPGRPLGFLYLLDTEEPPAWRTTAFVLRVRRGGFLVGVPVEPRVSSTITALGSENTEDVIIFRTASVEAETPQTPSRGRSGNHPHRRALELSGNVSEAGRCPSLGAARADPVQERWSRGSARAGECHWGSRSLDQRRHGRPCSHRISDCRKPQRRGGRRRRGRGTGGGRSFFGGGAVACSGRGATRLDHAAGHDCSTRRPAWSPDLVSRRPSGNKGTTERGPNWQKGSSPKSRRAPARRISAGRGLCFSSF